MHNVRASWRQLASLCVVCLASMLLLMLWHGGRLSHWRGPQGAGLYPDAFERKLDTLSSLVCRERSFARGQTLSSVLLAEGLSPQQADELAAAGREAFDLRSARPGDLVRLWRDRAGGVRRLELRKADGGQTLFVCRTPVGLIASRAEPSYTVRLAQAEGTIYSSLYEDGLRAGLDGRLVMGLADVFAWDIDFLNDLQPGDSFRVIYEQKLADAGPVKAGRILAAEMVNGGSVHTAYYFDDGEGHANYYDADGHSLRKEFLKSPLRYARVSSTFSYSRLHPILKIRRPHLGVDYAAPNGTPVEAVADGRVVYCGWKSGFGNYLEVKHRRNMVTSYGHLRGLAGGLRRGSLVQQGEVIGYVGATGMATGPHLDFRLAEAGTWVDPLKQRGQPAEPVKLAMRGRFEAVVTRVRAQFPSFEPTAR